MVSFSKRIKDDLLMMPAPPYCCSAAELCAYLMIFGKKDGNIIKISVEDKFLSDRISALIYKTLKINIEPLKLGAVYSLMLEMKGKAKEKFGFLFFSETDGEKKAVSLEEVYKKSCCRAAFLRGIFIACGTLMNPEKSYNLEFLIKDGERAEEIREFLKSFEINLKKAERKGKTVLYVKNSDVICDILTYIGAYNAQMEILNLKIEREIRNGFNRASNGETANMDKTIKASIANIKAIEKIDEVCGIDGLPEELRETAELRLKFRDLSIEALAKKHSAPISKSGVNHRLKKIMKIAENL